MNDSKGLEWPTLGLLAMCYCLWAVSGLILYPAFPVAGLFAMAVTAALHASLQHEVLHGHPTRSAAVNEWLVALPLAVFYPYRRFRQMHLRHHCDERLTDPYDDPESWYRAAADHGRLPSWLRLLLRLNNAFLGRLVLGPPLMVAGFLASEAGRLARGERGVRRAWLNHVAGLAVLFWLVGGVMGIDPLLYVVTVAWGGLSIVSVRTFCEHKWDRDPDGRTVIVERGGVFGFLFLWNNLHFVHHKLPRAPWYALPALYRARAEDWRRENGGYVFPDYWAIIRAYALRPKEPVDHPAWRTGEAAAPAPGGSFHPVALSAGPQIGCNAAVPAKADRA